MTALVPYIGGLHWDCTGTAPMAPMGEAHWDRTAEPANIVFFFFWGGGVHNPEGCQGHVSVMGHVGVDSAIWGSLIYRPT